ncbi:aspartate/tyrosine/aromatic aminotransferase [Oceanicola sp. D3]|uniref:amino acid aminotransferase n=1 Tax=Oceanicola sp. D3 TaxID=2587163 RepID=UPI00111F2BE7|nr:amino acid aminotransferase [Oceanicola sp. D3]QDC08427.1 aspartate/tyrosine/aromatic aminotransferase [Oceanicola sp. D3]
MLEAIPPREEDKILRLMKLFAEDPRMGKIDLGVGVYHDAEGRTPIFGAVKAAEQRLVEQQESKGYVGLAGDPAFHRAMAGLVLGALAETLPYAACGTPGGTGAVRQGFELMKLAGNPQRRIWLPDPSWINHGSILDTLGIPRAEYRYYDAATGGIDRDGMLEDLGRAAPGDVVLLHGCCHNPTGADLSLQDWAELTRLLAARGLTPFVDLAYQGFGDGLEADVAGLRDMVAALPETIITVSASKNFGLYRERVGCVIAPCADPKARDMTHAALAWLNRQNYAFPPDHGARVVTEILTDPGLRTDWQGELDGMRERMKTNRTALAAELRRLTGSDRFGFLQAHKGMFTQLGLTPAQVMALREAHGLYMVEDSRINLAGLTDATIPPAAEAIAAVL